MRLIEKYKETNEKEKLEAYLKEAGYYEQMDKEASKNPNSKYRDNVELLFDIAAKF